MRLTGTRHERWRVDLLDRHDQYKRELREFLGGSYEQNANRLIRGGGSLDLSMRVEDDDIDWGQDRFQVWYSPGYDGQERVWWERGVFLPSLPEIEYDDETGLMSGQVKIMDKLLILDRDKGTGSFSLPAGTNVVQAVRDLIASVGEVRTSLEESDETLKSTRVWEPDTSKLQVINDLLSTIGYTNLHSDGGGRFRAQKQVPVDRRGITWEFRQGRDSLHIPRWTRNDDWADTPNRVVMISQGDEETEAMMAVETITEATHPGSKFSYERRGNLWITHTETDVQVTSQAVLDDLAKMRLGGLATTYSNLSVQHAMLDLWPEDRVNLETDVVSTSAEVRSFEVDMAPGSLVAGSWREIIDA